MRLRQRQGLQSGLRAPVAAVVQVRGRTQRRSRQARRAPGDQRDPLSGQQDHPDRKNRRIMVRDKRLLKASPTSATSPTDDGMRVVIELKRDVHATKWCSTSSTPTRPCRPPLASTYGGHRPTAQPQHALSLARHPAALHRPPAKTTWSPAAAATCWPRRRSASRSFSACLAAIDSIDRMIAIWSAPRADSSQPPRWSCMRQKLPRPQRRLRQALPESLLSFRSYPQGEKAPGRGSEPAPR